MNKALQPTFVPFLDKLLGGGTAPHGVYGLLGPTGVGKTHLASMIATNGATCGSVFEETRRRSHLWILFDIETQWAWAEQRIFSHAAQVPRGNVWCGHATPQSYEREQMAALPQKQGRLMSEVERLNYAEMALRTTLAPICSDDLYEQSSDGGALKFANFLDWIAELVAEYSSKKRLGGIVIDGVSNVFAHSKAHSSMPERKFISDFVGNFCRELSRKYRCIVWVTHQVNGTASNASPAAPLSHRDAARCKGFADSLDACFVLGCPSIEGVFSIQCTKSKSGFAKLDRLPLMHDEDLATIIEADDYVEDRYRRTWKQRPCKNTSFGQVELEELDEMLNRLR